MNTKLFVLILLVAITGIVASFGSIVLIAMGTDMTVGTGQTWTLVMIITTFVAELLVYLAWKIHSSNTSFWALVDRLAIFMIVYAAIVFSTDNLLYLVAVGVAIFAWRDLYEEVGGMTGEENSQRLILAVLLRILVRPFLRIIYLFVGLFGGTNLFQNQFYNLLTGITVIIMAFYTLKLRDEFI